MFIVLVYNKNYMATFHGHFLPCICTTFIISPDHTTYFTKQFSWREGDSTEGAKKSDLLLPVLAPGC